MKNYEILRKMMFLKKCFTKFIFYWSLCYIIIYNILSHYF